ncbi:hypothetical protein H310_11486 [Aphanomyces invadans]|uniref:Acidic fibroblast growth factor intracellular-binding protein n=1 Tax=Aphanomyces invadans TaxID=157072 RepID=A0A024TLA3_9STRA|nr:hypothetical protein H310_11486 [Aphanomyces invadans]ETV94818.1 hypothetical protein H310_11486 [Aphanomyces invadans]|eukprot:XP_008876409.1 hypothetical protein H310_11486 [Aphanomyces invadans]
MREIFDTFLTDPVLLSEDVFALWLEGQNTSNALEIRFRSYAHPPPVSSTLDYSETNELDQLRDLIWRDTVDQYRLFEKLEMYLMQPLLLRTQLLFQIPPWQQLEMTEKYYGFDGAVVRRLLGKKLTSRAQKDLDEVSENSLRTLKNCRRQFENLRRVYVFLEEKNFQGPLTRLICEQFLISEKLAAKYACVVFLLHGRFEVHPSHKLVGFLSWHDVQFFAALLMGHWVAPSTKRHHHSKLDAAASVKPLSFSVLTESSSTLSNDGHSSLDWPNLAFLEARVTPMSARACVGVDLNQRMTNSLRDLKAHFLNDADTLNEYRNLVMSVLQVSLHGNQLEHLGLKMLVVIRGLLAIGAGLSQPKELKDLIEDLVDAAGIVFKDSKLRLDDIDVIFSALIEWGRRLAILGGLIRGVPSSLGSIDVWYLNADDTRLHLLASWELFLSVCRAILVTIYDRI